jgi:hypothetical protein
MVMPMVTPGVRGGERQAGKDESRQGGGDDFPYLSESKHFMHPWSLLNLGTSPSEYFENRANKPVGWPDREEHPHDPALDRNILLALRVHIWTLASCD